MPGLAGGQVQAGGQGRSLARVRGRQAGAAHSLGAASPPAPGGVARQAAGRPQLLGFHHADFPLDLSPARHGQAAAGSTAGRDRPQPVVRRHGWPLGREGWGPSGLQYLSGPRTAMDSDGVRGKVGGDR